MTRVIAHFMPDACAGHACPAPEIWGAVVNGDLPSAECARLDDHAEQCPYCTAERGLARRFVDNPAASDDVRWIVDRVGASVAPAHDNVVALRPRRRQLLAPLIGLAAAAMLVVAFAPMLPLLKPTSEVPATDNITRGTRIGVVAPRGELGTMPSTLEWAGVAGAERYRVSIRDVAGDLVWSGDTSGTALSLPADGRERLHRAVVYYWTVEAYNAAGEPTAQSGEIDFVVQP